MNKRRNGTKRKSNKFRLFMVIAVLILAVCFIISTSERGGEYIQNYMVNFKNNVVRLADKFHIAISDTKRTELTASPSPDVSEPPTEANTSQPQEATEPPITSATIAPKTAVTGNSISIAKSNATNAQYTRYSDLLLCADETSMIAYNKSGQVAWEVPLQIGTPILKTKGAYILVAESGGKKLMLFKGKKQIYATETSDEIVSACVSSAGDVAVVMNKAYYKGSVGVYNKKGTPVFVWNSGADSVLDADISSGARRLAVSLLGTTDTLKSTVMFFDITKTEAYDSVSYDGCVLFDIEFIGETLNAVGDDRIIGISTNAKQQWETEYSGKILNHYKIENTGNKLFAFDNQNISSLELLNGSGKSVKTLKAELLPDYIDIYSGYCAYNSGRDIMFGKFSGKDLKKYSAPKDVQGVTILNNNLVAVVYSSSIELVTMQ